MSPMIPQIGPGGTGPQFVPQEGGAQASPVGAAVSGFGESIGKLVPIFAAQQAHADALQSAKIENDFQTALKLKQAEIPASADPAKSLLDFNQTADALKAQYLQQAGDNSRILPGLTVKLDAIHNGARVEQTIASMKAAAASADATTGALLPQLAITAATIGDPVASAKASAAAEGLISRLPYEKQEAVRLGFQQRILFASMDDVAVNRPADLRAFLDKHQTEIPPDKVQAALGLANQALESPQKFTEATRARVQAQALSEYDQQLATGHLDLAKLESDVQFGRITKEDYARLRGTQFQYPTDPTTKGTYTARIANADSAEDLNQIKTDIHTAQASGLVNGKDVPVFESAIGARTKLIGTAEHQAEALALDQIRRSYQSVGGAQGEMYDAMAKNQGFPTRAEMSENAIAQFRALAPGVKVTEYPKLIEQAVKHNQPIGHLAAGFETIGVAAPAMSDDEARDFYWKHRAGVLPAAPTPTPAATPAPAPEAAGD